ncbi:GNAT family N-acetyltransferase [Pseudoalteromonas luteoviolacea]|uniref:GNAT family N-acetyltransferase n=1 Tax=Pseudoalteromonas luteoviolacea TaxID=43657 RepID=UPI001F3D898D|nr:GNAT family N-acetyltransferase [Pseudoalteromonas luteoviolacea]MCF6442729.1 GNAT family N-acetyltransferase [Pseudoalteromonas luteoviolacea]
MCTRITLLFADSKELHQVATWYYEQWDSKRVNSSVSDVIAKLSSTDQRLGFTVHFNEQLAGAAEIKFMNGRCWLDGVYVDGHFRGKGLAEELVNFAKQQATERGWSSLNLKCEPDLIALYQKYGFAVFDTRDGKSLMTCKLMP